MFIFDGTTAVVFVFILVIVYVILELSENEKFKTVQSKGSVSILAAAILTLLYAYFISTGSETLLPDSYVDAGSKFNTVSGIENIKSMAEI